MLNGCTISFDGNDINYRKNGDLLFFYRETNNNFYLRYKIWTNFENKYSLNNQELKEFFVSVVEEVLNYKEVTPYTSACLFYI